MEQQATPIQLGNVVFGADPFVAKWVNEQIGIDSSLATQYKAIGFLDPTGEKLGAGIIYFDYRKDDIEAGLAIADRRTVTREMISVCCEYPFKQIGCKRVTVFVKKKHFSLRKIAERIGFKMEGVKRGTDICMYGLLAADAAKWMR